MKLYVHKLTPERGQKRIDDARDAGKQGAKRVPDSALFGDGVDPTDSMILDVTTAYFEGVADRKKEPQP